MSSPRHQAAVILIAGIVLFFAAEHSIPALYNVLPISVRPWDRVDRRMLMIREEPDADVLILGDSTAVLSVIPEVFRQATGLRTLNLATYADRDDVVDPMLLLTYLEHHPPPKAVIVVRSILSWDKGYGFELFRQQINRPDLAKALFDAGVMSKGEYALVLRDAVFPSFRYRELFALVRHALLHPDARQKNMEDYAAGREWLGYEPFDPRMHNTNLELNQKNIDTLHSVATKDGHVNFALYALPMAKELCAIAQRNGTRLFFSFGPNAAVLKDDPLMASLTQEVHAKLQETLAGYDACGQFPTVQIMESEYLSDLTHTNHEGAQVFTTRLAEEFLKSSR